MVTNPTNNTPPPDSPNDTLNQQNQLSRGARGVVWVSVGAIVLYVAAALYADIEKLGARLGTFQWGFWAAALGLSLVNYAVRAVRWQYYLQCIGRVVRTPEGVEAARAFVIEIADNLPNISYRIDNRWLFSEISDYLEPSIEDVRVARLFRALVVIFRLLILRASLGDL